MTNGTDPAGPDRAGSALQAGQDRSTTALDAICRRVVNLNERAGNHESRLEDLRDRLLVAEPKAEQVPNKQPEEVCGQVGQIERQLTRLEETLDHTTTVVSRLEDL